MENNKILIGVQFIDKNDKGQELNYNIELMVLRDITLGQLIEGIKVGIHNLASESKNDSILSDCAAICDKCFENAISKNNSGKEYYKNITFYSFDYNCAKNNINITNRPTFFKENENTPICELGFITSSRLIFDATGVFWPKKNFQNNTIIEAFNPEKSSKIVFPKYNISTRLLYEFDGTSMEIIPPSEPPKKSNHGLFYLLMPTILSTGILLLSRSIINTSSGNGSFIIFSAIMGVSAIVTTAFSYFRQKKEYDQSFKDWKCQYSDYINNLISKIKRRQNEDIAKLNELYPDVYDLINKEKSTSVFSLNDNLYSRTSNDKDFLSFRIGLSDNVPSKFEVLGNSKDSVYSEAYFNCEDDVITIDIQKDKEQTENNLSALPGYLSNRFSCLKNAPLLYKLSDKRVLGIVDKDVDEPYSLSQYMVSRMIFELCYYHSPEQLQFVILFPNETDYQKIEQKISPYKFMPHFHGLFSGKSQFVFNSSSATNVFGSLCEILKERKSAEDETANTLTPHIVVIVFDEYGLKEDALAEFLPQSEGNQSDVANALALTFVFAEKYKEYLPSYCDDVITLGNECKIIPRNDTNKTIKFKFEHLDTINDKTTKIKDLCQSLTETFDFSSALYYEKIAQNRKIPSMVALFDAVNETTSILPQSYKNDLKRLIEKNWRINSSDNDVDIDVTKSIKAVIGKTDKEYTYLNLHEKGDGPHMLVAGTTGSGKTETIISYLLGLCLRYRPDELNLLLVDMKGGGFTKRIGCLPHVVGTITDVDGDENGTGSEYMLGRFLFAVKAEIKRRKILFNKINVDNIDDYINAVNNIEKYIKIKNISDSKLADNMRTIAKDPESHLSHLILVVDEFTELKRFSNENSEIDYMGEITTIARIGRSLGLHIILISQNIEGAITDDIRANVNARLCLRVATKQASKDMIGSELAALPSMPGNGRAYLLIGTGSRNEYFQSAYSGVSVNNETPIEISLVNKCGEYSTFYKSSSDNGEKKQLSAVIEAINDIYEEYSNVHISKPHVVFQKPLSNYIVWDGKNGVKELDVKE